MVSCSDWYSNSPLSRIKVELWYGQQEMSCAKPIDSDTFNWSIELLAFFLSDLSIEQDGQQLFLPLTSNDWQTTNLALLRFTKAQCADKKQQVLDDDVLAEQPFQSLQLAVPLALAETTQLRFTLGLPFDINHLNPLSQPSPLNMPSMFWSWRGGHKFLRLDMLGEQDAWNFHLGSTGCTSASAMRSPQTECVHANTLHFSLSKQQQGERLIVHLDKLLQGLELNGRNSCLMQSDKTSCQVLMSNLTDNGVFEWR
ncbi:MbnP family copper-binding protein [Paraglaciecola hydrolytica]|nr:MbnP family copper-binding protein [Paraglaciecola hydrolytica]